jgi:hypothetical protein
MNAPVSAHERARLAALHQYCILDTLPGRDFDAPAALAAQICGTPMALISPIDATRQWFKAEMGITAVDVVFVGLTKGRGERGESDGPT